VITNKLCGLVVVVLVCSILFNHIWRVLFTHIAVGKWVTKCEGSPCTPPNDNKDEDDESAGVLAGDVIHSTDAILLQEFLQETVPQFAYISVPSIGFVYIDWQGLSFVVVYVVVPALPSKHVCFKCCACCVWGVIIMYTNIYLKGTAHILDISQFSAVHLKTPFIVCSIKSALHTNT
jgi:hypothetical protein